MGTLELFNLVGKVALITGGSRGLGLQIAEGLGEMGCKVAITARKADALAADQSVCLEPVVQQKIKCGTEAHWGGRSLG